MDKEDALGELPKGFLEFILMCILSMLRTSDKRS